MTKIDVIIPVYEPTEKLKKQLQALVMQTIRPVQIILMHTEDGVSLSEEKKICRDIPVKEIMIRKSDYDHGGTRDKAIREASSDIVVMMTQDAVPVDSFLLEHLVNAFQQDEKIAVSYARQEAGAGSDSIEQYTRRFNYPLKSCVKSLEDLKRLGIKTYFCSNVCAAYRRDIYLKTGGFEKNIIFNEDMIFAANIMEQGYKTAYVAEAVVIHSHNYTCIQQLKRNFDQGVSQIDYSHIFAKVKSETEGVRLVKQTAVYLLKQKKPFQIVKLFILSAAKYIGFRVGRNYRKLPKRLIIRLTVNPEYWDRQEDTGE